MQSPEQQGKKKLPVSGFVIAFNEEQKIADCLQSLSFCEELIVVDSGSNDFTKQIAESFGATVVYKQFTNYREQKQFALELCTQPWALSLDADERISPEAYKDIAQIDFANTEIAGFEFKRLHFFLNKWIYHSGLFPDYKLRLFQKDKGAFVGNGVHEVVKVKGKIQKLQSSIYHYAWNNTQDFLKRQLKYAKLVAENKYQEGKSSNFLGALFRGLFNFIYRYIFRLGFLDAFPGFAICSLNAYVTFQKYLHLNQLSHKESFILNKLLPSQKSKAKPALFIIKHFLSPLIQLCFLPIAIVYGSIVSLRIKFYDWGVLKSKSLDIPVISVGNLTLGGSGKTPFTIWLVQKLKEVECENIAVLSKGYKSKSANRDPIEVTNKHLPSEVGDEPLLIKQNLTKQLTESNKNKDSVVVCTSRYEAGKYAKEELNASIAILDDGFQHIQLKRDSNICLVDCSDNYFENIFPLGSRRESLKQIKRASTVVLTRTENHPQKAKRLTSLIKKVSPQINILELEEAFAGFYSALDETLLQIEDQTKVIAFCALGNPQQFFDSLKDKCLLQDEIAYEDHYKYQEKDLNFLIKKLENENCKYLITTEKDFIKLKELNLSPKSLPKSLKRVLIAKNEITGFKGIDMDAYSQLLILLGFDILRYKDTLNNLRVRE